jgi:hypothetical protein
VIRPSERRALGLAKKIDEFSVGQIQLQSPRDPTSGSVRYRVSRKAGERNEAYEAFSAACEFTGHFPVVR